MRFIPASATPLALSALVFAEAGSVHYIHSCGVQVWPEVDGRGGQLLTLDQVELLPSLIQFTGAALSTAGEYFPSAASPLHFARWWWMAWAAATFSAEPFHRSKAGAWSARP